MSREILEHIQQTDGPFTRSLNLNFSRFRDKPIVMSNEGFHGEMQFDDRDDQRVLRYQQVTVKFIADICPSAKIIIVVRSPEKWLHSLYNYYIIIGNSLKLSQYMDRWGLCFGA